VLPIIPTMQRATHTTPLKGISSKATQAVLADLARAYAEQSGISVQIESVGGVDAAKRVQNSPISGEAFDVVLLAADAIDRLIHTGHLLAGSRSDWVRSPVAVAVRAGAGRPDISSEASLKAAVLAAPTLGYSTGPSGVYLEQLFTRWGIADVVKSRIVTPPPGTPVGALIAKGQVALGFQQLSELIALPGITVLGELPPEVACITTFSAGIPVALAHSPERLQAVQDWLAFLTNAQSASTESIKRRHGMSWGDASART
jgi:molybdate transport system substrate-binding protein